MKTTFKIATPTRGVSFDKQMDELLSGLHAAEGVTLIASRVYLTDICNQLPQLRKHPLWEELGRGAVSYIEQPPLDGTKISLLLCYADGVVTRGGSAEARIVEADGLRYFFQSVRLTAEEAGHLDVKQQTELLFERHIEWLKSFGLNLKDHCQRTWIYVRDIDHNYAAVVDGRNAVFAREGLTPDTHFISSTGIGGEGEASKVAVCMDFYAVDHPESVDYLHATDYLNPTINYGVAFERGTKLRLGTETHSLISGTASIDNKGRCINLGNVEKQADRLFLNIDQLLRDGGTTIAKVGYFVVYLRDVADYACMADYMNRHFPGVPCVVLAARVCRPDWLVEVECRAIE